MAIAINLWHPFHVYAGCNHQYRLTSPPSSPTHGAHLNISVLVHMNHMPLVSGRLLGALQRGGLPELQKKTATQCDQVSESLSLSASLVLFEGFVH